MALEAHITTDLRSWTAASKLLTEGHNARREGRNHDALRLFGEAVATDESNAEAHSVYGLMLLRLGQANAAESHLRRAVFLAPNNPAFAMNLAEWCGTTQKPREARALLSSIVERLPGFHWAWDRLGDLQFQAGEFLPARDSYFRVVQANPGSAEPLLKFAHACIEADRLDEAKRAIADAARLQPDRHALFRTQAALFQRIQDWAALESAANTRIEAEPGDSDAWLGLSRAQLERRKLKSSLSSYERAVQLGGATETSLAALCMQVNAFEAADEALKRAEQLDPADPGFLRLKSGLLMYKGAYAEAEACCEKLLAANPRDGNAYRVLTQLKNARLPDDKFNGLLALTADAQAPDTDRVLACYAAADCLDARNEFDAAFQKYDLANAIARRMADERGIRYDPHLREQQIAQLIAYSGALTPPSPAHSTPRLIFIVGMPRSGTTLVESVLSAHSEVLPGGEYHAMRWIMDDVGALAKATQPDLANMAQWLAWRDLYIEGMPSRSNHQFVTDKHPFNFDALGVIKCLFPDARIVHVRRNPLETGLSIFRNHFESRHSFATNLANIGHYLGQYAKLMSHWEKLFADRIVTIQYEQFVTQFADASQVLIEGCGLAWEPQCLEIDKSARLISTLSTMQARRSPRLSERAHHYMDHLAPLVDALTSNDVDLVTGRLRADTVTDER